MDIVSRYGIKEVANIALYEIDDLGNLSEPVLVLDTLQISNIKRTAEQTTHYGGIGNAPLLSWEHSPSVEVQVTDALFSMKSLAVFCGGSVDKNQQDLILKTETFKATETSIPLEGQDSSGWKSYFFTLDGKSVLKRQPRFYNIYQEEVETFDIGETYFCTYFLEADSLSIEISEVSFPNYYCVIGETYARSEITGRDEPFFFVIPKAKLTTDLAIDLSSEEPSTFDLTFKAVQFQELNLIELIKCKELEEQIINDDDSLAILGKAILGKLILGKGEK